MIKTLETTNFSQLHDDPKFRNILNVMILFYKWVLPEAIRTKTSVLLYNLEVEHHGGDEVEAKNCMKSHLHLSVYKIVYEEKFPGITRRYFHKIEIFMNDLENNSLAWWVLSKVRQVFTIYLDIFKDFYISLIIFNVSGGFVSLLAFPTKLTSVVFYCFLLSILLPLLISSYVLARDKTKQLGPSATRKQKLGIYTKTMALSIINPMLIVNEYETKKEEMKQILKDSVTNEDGVDVDAIIKLLEDQDILRKQYLEFVKTDLGIETIFQTAGQTVLLWLAETETPTTGGLELIFKKDLLTLSVILSLKTCVSLHIKSISLEKPFFPITSKVFLYLLTFLSLTKRILSIILFFAPSFGLFSLLVHSKFEQIPFAVRLNRNISSSDVLYMNGKPPVLWSKVDRWNHQDPDSPVPPHYTMYTGLDLEKAFLVFWIIFVFHVSSVIITKLLTAKQMRKSNILDIILHAVQNSNIPFADKDWDVDNGTIEDHRARFGKTLIEVNCVMAVNFFFNSLLLGPLIYTGQKLSIFST